MKTPGLDHLVIRNSLLHSQLFAGVNAPDLSEICALSRVRSLEKDETLFREGDRCDGFFVVQRGVICVHRVSASGKVQVIHIFHAGDSFAEAALTSEDGYPASARALAPSAVILIPKTEFMALLRRRPELGLRMVASMSRHLREVVGLLDDLTLKNAEARCINWLLRHRPSPYSREPFKIELEHPKRIMAAELNLASETLSRTLSKLRDKNLIRSSRTTIFVLDPQRIEALMHQLLAGTLEPLARSKS